MIEQPPPGLPTEQPPPQPINQAQGCFRVLLWLMPTGFPVFSAWAIDHYKPPGDSLLLLWIGMNLVFSASAGWFVAIMSSRIRGMEPGKRAGEIVWLTTFFCLIQLFLIPLITAFLAFAFCALMPR